MKNITKKKMKTKKKKGFTLIELLAVIVILAVIMVITIPTVLGSIENSKKSAFESSFKAIVKAAEKEYEMRELYGDISEIKCEDLGVDKERYNTCEISFDSKGKALLTLEGKEENNYKISGTLNDHYINKLDKSGIVYNKKYKLFTSNSLIYVENYIIFKEDNTIDIYFPEAFETTDVYNLKIKKEEESFIVYFENEEAFEINVQEENESISLEGQSISLFS